MSKFHSFVLFQHFLHLCCSVLQDRLDRVAKAGLPIWISELDIRESDVEIRADHYEDLVRLFFSHDAVEGILLWGFWDGAHWCVDCVLANGPEVTVSAF